MVPPTRRRALLGAAGLLAALAGCNDTDDADGPDGTRASPTEPRQGLQHVATDPEHVILRASQADRDSPLAWVPEDGATTDSGTVPRDERRRAEIVASESTAASLRLADVDAVSVPTPRDSRGQVAESVDDVRAFVDATDFDRETIYVDQSSVEECYRRVLCYVSWDDTEVETQYGDVLRDFDTACEADVEDEHVVVIRIPAALDPERITGGGWGVSRGGCPPPPGQRPGPDSAREPTTIGGAAATDANPTDPTPGTANGAAEPSPTDGGGA